ncbi:hypothetical protein GALL_243410 [mine drainage metagenome]|uniref:Uncharacterized protein n=1 Tax=mine drainage metagenome TaxID=410659 RepID=A0A1J5S077_9ZZZZ
MIYRSLRTLRRMAVRAGVELRRQYTLLLQCPAIKCTVTVIPDRVIRWAGGEAANLNEDHHAQKVNAFMMSLGGSGGGGC